MTNIVSSNNQAIVVIISTTGRKSLVDVAVPSILHQKRLPDFIYIVADSDGIIPVHDISELNTGKIPIKFLLNNREKNLSGAMNTVLSEMISDNLDPEKTYIAVLDDDDWWDSDYLESCFNAALLEQSDWVISGIIRHESDSDPGKYLSIPEVLTERSFLTGNPHIQGSNLFIRFSKVLLAGGYDENLPSTTDRDLCLRVMALGNIKITKLKRYMVHYLAYGRGRLSESGSEKKCRGLERFYNKYSPFMDDDTLKLFLERAKGYFNCNPEYVLETPGEDATTELMANREEARIELIIGVILSEQTYFRNLVSDIIELHNITDSVAALVVSDNVGLTEDIIQENRDNLAGAGIKLRVIDSDEAMKSADRGDLGYYYTEEKNRKGISFGRTVLHRYVYLESMEYQDPVAWIIDDDVSLQNIYWGTLNRSIDKKDFVGHLNRWRKEGISIVVGKVGGDPPVPIMSTSRTQMLDLYYNFKALAQGSSVTGNQRKVIDRNDIMKTVPAYFYDFPDKDFRHLETPIWKDLQNITLDQLSENASLILRKAIFRIASYPPAGKGLGGMYYYQDTEDFGPVRGGNTIVLDMDCLRDFTNASPISGDIPYRRGDTLWVVLNKRLGPRRPIKRTRTIISSQLMLVQDRRKDETTDKMIEKLVSDTLGSAFVRSMDSFLFERVTKTKVRWYYYDSLNFTDTDIINILKAMEGEIDKRVRMITLNAWRIRGLIQSIKWAIAQNITTLNGPGEIKEVDRIYDVCSRMESLFSESEIEKIIDQARNFNREDVTNFLLNLSKSCQQFSDALPIRYSDGNIAELSFIIKKTFNSGDLHTIGEGKEGIVFSDGINAYKYFHYGKFSLDRSNLHFLKDKIVGKKYNSIAKLNAISMADNHLIFKEDYEAGKTYMGGKLDKIISLLKECKSNGIVIKNIAPKNLVDNGRELKFVDLGRDIEPYTDTGFMNMCRRSYLTLRWYFRPDIHEVFHRSYGEQELPELFGFGYFLDLLQEKQTGEISIPFVTEELSGIKNDKLLDYGCGNGRIADELSKSNDVSVYDKDMSGFYKRHYAKNAPVVMTREDLKRTSQEINKFDIVLVSLVLCTVDDTEAREILRDVRKVVNNDGEIAIVICNPFNVNNIRTETHEKVGCLRDYHDLFTFEKIMKTTGNIRHEYHRPLDWYIMELKRAGFTPNRFSESTGASFDYLSPGSEFLMIRAHASDYSEKYDASLMIKASPMEWRTIGYQVRHIVGQLEGPEKFREKFIITDNASGNFARQYDFADLDAFDREITKLMNDGVIDSVIYASDDISEKEKISERWFGIKCSVTRSTNGQPVLTTLQGFEHASSRYILQVDSDCIISRDGTEKSYLKEMMDVLTGNETAVSVSFPICNLNKRPFTPRNGSGKWRTEVRNCLIDMKRLISLLPLPNSLNEDGVLELPWHRALDKKLISGTGESYRGSEGNACFIHVPNSMKKNLNLWYNAVKYYKYSQPDLKQYGHVDLQAKEVHDVLEGRREDIIVVVKGRDVPIPKIRRCFRSLLEQDLQEFGVIYIDAASKNGSDEYVQFIVKSLFQDRITLFRNYVPLTSMENIFIAIRTICRNPESIIVLLDADDALIGKDALSKVKFRYAMGADLTVGTMIRTDKYRKYIVNFDNPRLNRGGNVWQHLRTFRKYLFDMISPMDFKIDGKWIEEADDWAYMLPMVEMSKHPEVIHDIIYFYEPSPEKKERNISKYENTIAKIVAKPSYRKINNIQKRHS